MQTVAIILSYYPPPMPPLPHKDGGKLFTFLRQESISYLSDLKKKNL